MLELELDYLGSNPGVTIVWYLASYLAIPGHSLHSYKIHITVSTSWGILRIKFITGVKKFKDSQIYIRSETKFKLNHDLKFWPMTSKTTAFLLGSPFTLHSML